MFTAKSFPRSEGYYPNTWAKVMSTAWELLVHNHKTL